MIWTFMDSNNYGLLSEIFITHWNLVLIVSIVICEIGVYEIKI